MAMKKQLLLLFLLCIQFSFSQKFVLKIEGKSIPETQTIDSIGYNTQHKDVASILKTQEVFEKKLYNTGFFESKLISQTKLNDSTFVFQYSLGKPTQLINIYIDNIYKNEKKLLNIEKDTITIAISDIENWMQNKINILETKGYSLAKLQLTNQSTNHNIIIADLKIQLNSKRQINDLVILGYDKFPKNIKHNWKRKLKNRTFNQKLVDEIYTDFEQFPFVNQTKYPEILFTKDSTKVYTYLEKARPNKFDGFIGFANDENSKLVFNGYLDLVLQNILNGGEKFNLFWKNDGKQQTSFNLGTEIPYIFKSPLGIKANLNIFKQDSTFQNTQSEFNLGYYLSYNTKLYFGLQNTTSIDIQNSNNTSLRNFKNRFYNTSFEYLKRNNSNLLFPEKTNLFLKIGIGNRTILNQKTTQFFSQINFNHILTLNSKNSINLKNQTFYLNSNDYVVNELFRFGGINSIRGFRENTLQANFFSGLFLEYRYQLAPSLYIHSITDYGYFQDKTSELQNSLLGLGFGFGLITNNGLFHLVYSNGSTSEQAIKLSNSIIQISFVTNF